MLDMTFNWVRYHGMGLVEVDDIDGGMEVSYNIKAGNTPLRILLPWL